MATLYNLYEDYVLTLDPILYEMGRVNGVHIHRERQEALRSQISKEIKELVAEAQDLVPSEIKPRSHYKKHPPEGREAIPVMVPGKVKACSICGARPIKKGEHITKGGKKNPCREAEVLIVDDLIEEYDVIEDFNPLSGPQLKTYALHFKHPLGRSHKSKAGETLDDKHLKKLIKRYGDKHRIYQVVKLIRGKNKVLSTYVDAYRPDESGRIYGWFTHNPETFRLAMKNVNLMNVPHRGDAPYAEEIRATIIPPPGYVFVEADSASIEAVMTGYYMGSKAYMEYAKRGIHALWACQSLGLDPTPENIRYVKNAKEHALLYARKKRTVHGVSYGMGPRLLYATYEDLFDSPAHAAQEIEDFYRFAPDLKRWHKEIRDYAFKHGYLQSPWGLKNYFYQVYRKDYDEREGKWKWVLGEDGKAVIAYLPQHSNAMFQRENLKIIHARKRPDWIMPAIGHVHDSITLAVPEDEADAAVELLAEVMHRPIKQMGGLQIGVEVKVGEDWDAMKSVKVVS